MRILATAISLLGFAAMAGLSGCQSPPAREPIPEVFYPGPPEEARLQLLARYTDSVDVEEPDSFTRFVAGGEEVRMVVTRAHGVAWHSGRIYVCDPGAPAVIVFDLPGRQMRKLEPEMRGLFKKPLDIEITADGWKYVTDTAHRKVLVFNAEDKYQTAFGDPETWRPVGIAATDKELFVTDAANHAVVVLDRKTGAELRRLGTVGKADGEFYYPVSIDVGPDNDLYVSDSFNFRVQRLRADGTFIRSFGAVGRNLGNLARPRGVSVDREGRVYVLDGAFQNCQVFDPEGKLLLYFGAPGGGPGAVNMPSNIEIDYEAVDAFRGRVAPGYELDYVLFITSQAGPNKVNVYGFLRKKG